METVSPGKIIMIRGWGDVAWVCHAEGALAIHFEYDGTSTLFFKVFDEEGCRLECCPEGGRWDGATAGLASGSSCSSGGTWESSDSPEPYETLEMSDDSYVPPSSRRARSAAMACARHRR